jgi:SOUL heme-binding protein
MVVKKLDKYFLRLYEPYVALSVGYTHRQEAYDAIAGYFKGLNKSEGVTFVETQPIMLCYFADGSKQMRAYVGPSSSGEQLALNELPQPLLAGSQLVAAGGLLCACLPFNGNVTPSAVTSTADELKFLLQQDGIILAAAEADGFVSVAQYGPVYSLAERYNEVILQVRL